MGFLQKIFRLIRNSKHTGFSGKERFITDINREVSVYLKNEFKIPKTEKILLVLDDSFLKNLSQVVIFTSRKIYWNIPNAYLKENTETSMRGGGLLNNKSLDNVSVFSKNDKDLRIIYIISGNIQLIIPFTNFQNESSLTLAFYDYLSNHCSGYRQNNDINEKLFNKIKKTNKIVSINIISLIFNALSYLIALLFMVNLVTRFALLDNAAVIYTFILLKSFSVAFGNKKSLYFNLLFIIITPVVVYLIGSYELLNFETSIYIIYTGIFLILGIFDFDTIFKYSAFIFAIISILYMIHYIVL